MEDRRRRRQPDQPRLGGLHLGTRIYGTLKHPERALFWSIHSKSQGGTFWQLWATHLATMRAAGGAKGTENVVPPWSFECQLSNLCARWIYQIIYLSSIRKVKPSSLARAPDSQSRGRKNAGPLAPQGFRLSPQVSPSASTQLIVDLGGVHYPWRMCFEGPVSNSAAARPSVAKTIGGSADDDESSCHRDGVVRSGAIVPRLGRKSHWRDAVPLVAG